MHGGVDLDNGRYLKHINHKTSNSKMPNSRINSVLIHIPFDLGSWKQSWYFIIYIAQTVFDVTRWKRPFTSQTHFLSSFLSLAFARTKKLLGGYFPFSLSRLFVKHVWSDGKTNGNHEGWPRMVITRVNRSFYPLSLCFVPREARKKAINPGLSRSSFFASRSITEALMLLVLLWLSVTSFD